MFALTFCKKKILQILHVDYTELFSVNFRCETCVEQLFFRGSGPCPRCGRILKKNEFRDQVFEDTYVEKEIAIRKKFIKELEKRRISYT